MAADDDDRDAAAFLRAGAGAEREGQHAGDEREGGHQNRAQAVAIGLENRGGFFHAAIAQRVHVVDLQDRIFLHDAEEHEEAERGIEVERVVGEAQREQREGHGERQRKENCERMNEALELRGENHVHENHGEQKGVHEFAKGLFHFASAARDARGEAGRHVQIFRRGAQGFEAVGERVAGRDRGAQADLALAVEAVDARGGEAGDDLHEVVEAHHAAALLRDVEARDGGRVVAVPFAQAELDIVVLVDARVAVARDVLIAADHEAQCGGDVLGVHAEFGGAGAVNLDAQLGHVEAQRRVGVDDAEARGEFAEFLGVARELHEVGAEN